jgi:hypothetical protein
VVEYLSEALGTSKASIREDLWPNLLAVHDSTLGGDPGEFTVAKHLGLSGKAHLALHGIPRSRKEARKILKDFDSENTSEPEEVIIEEIIEDGDSDEDETGGTQFSLDSF